MANRWFNQFKYSFLKYPAELHIQFAVGAAGVATLSAARSKGVTSVTRGGSAGLYTIVLNDKWQRLLQLHHAIVIAAGTSSGVVECVVKADNTNAAAQSVVLQFLDASGTAADIANGATVKMKLELTNSSLD
jgi:hypothetical protein